MQRLIIYAENTSLAAQTQTLIQRDLTNPVSVALDHVDLNRQLERRIYHLAVFNFTYVGDRELQIINSLKAQAQNMPSVVVVDRIRSSSYDRIIRMPDVHLLISPNDDKSITALVRKLLVSKKVPKQIYQRFNTNQIAELENLKSGNQLFSSMYNLSKGGAYCEVESSANLKVGDVVRLKVSIEKHRQHHLNAKIVWASDQTRVNGRSGFGLKFINAHDIHRIMASQV